MSEARRLPDATVADAVPGNWVDRRAPAALRPYLRLSRADRPVGAWLLLIPCLWAIALAAAADAGGPRPLDLWLLGSCAVGALLMRGAGCTWNDLTDRDFDAAVARTRSRPLPSGQVTPRQALAWAILQSLLAAGILFSYNGRAILLGVASLGLVAIYPFAKRFTWWPQVFLGLAFNWGALLMWVARGGHPIWPALLLYGAGIAWTLFYDTIYAHQDREDDALIGVKSTARLFGAATRPWLRGFLVIAVLLMAAGVCAALLPRGNPLQLAVALGGVWAFGWHLASQLARLDTDDAPGLLRLFRSNRDAGLIAALFFAAAALL